MLVGSRVDPVFGTFAVLGVGIGGTLQRSRFCFNSAFRDLIQFRSGRTMKGVVVGMTVATAGFGVYMRNLLPNPSLGPIAPEAQAGVITLRLNWAPRLQQSVGRPVRGRTIVIVDTHGRPLPPGQIGEVIVESTALARGYLGDVPPGTTIHEGRLHTGDLGWVDEDGHLFLVGRKNSLIHAAGVTVDPGAVEAVIARMPGVRDVAVVGTPDPAGGERVKAVVVAEGIATEQILHYCRGHLPDTHLPEVVEFRATIPRTPAGKILRRVMR